jgi:hypothetical protein
MTYLEREAMKSLIDLHLSVLEESGTQFGVSTTQDIKTILSRIENEGISFLTISLPKISKDLQRALADGQVAPHHFAGFRRSGNLPIFLGEWFERVFNPDTGELLDTPDVEAIRVLLQVTGMMKKVELECTEKRTKAAFDTYIEIESQVRSQTWAEHDPLLVDFRVWTHILFGDLLHHWQSLVINEDLFPKHGPGAVADKLRGNSKWNQPAWHDRLEEVFPFGRYAYSSYRHYLNDLDDGGRPSLPGTEMPVKVIAVPKTLETPRLIAVEPTCMQYMQQGLKDGFEKCVRSAKNGHMIDYESQVPNQDMARRGSIDGSLATLDLSEASDRVSNQLVRAMLQDFPELFRAVDATRSRSADVPGHGVIRLSKFASMGSALCFPIESMVFCIITMMGVYRGFVEGKGNAQPISRRKVISTFRGSVRTYGDDIIAPSKYAQAVADMLEAFGLKVNPSKSFWTGRFRESCGKEYFNGQDVTHVKARAVLPSRQQPIAERAESLVKTSALRNHLFRYGYWSTCRKLDQLMEGFIPYPAVGVDSPAIGRHSSLGYETQRIDDDLQIPMVRAFVVNVDSPSSKLDGYGALMKCIGNESEFCNPDPMHLQRAGRPSALRIKQRWTRAY